MAREAPEIRLIRETLEGVMHPSTASSVFFEALQASGGQLPRNVQEALALVRGPLAESLSAKLGEDEAESILEPLQRMLHAFQPAAPAARAPRRRPSRNDEPTRNLELSVDVLPVYVLSADKGFSDRLKAALGPNVMSDVWAGDEAMLKERLLQIPPALVVLDASNFPAIEPTELVRELARLQPPVLTAVWGADLPYGMSVLDAAQQRSVTLTPFDRREGIEPLMDLIRSRRA